MYYPYSPNISDTYKLVGPDGTVAVFNDITDPNYVGMITDVTGLDSADVRESATDLTEVDGGVHGNFYYGRRPIVLSGLVYGQGTVKQRMAKLDLLSRASNAMRGDSTLSWKLVGGLKNLVTNPGIEVSTAGYGTAAGYRINTGATLTRVTSQFHSGAAAMQVTTTAGSTTQGADYATLPVIAGVPVTASVWVKGNVGGEPLTLIVGDGTVGAASTSVSATTSWQRMSTTLIPTTSGTTGFAVSGGAAAVKTWFMDDAMAIYASTVPTYFDGDVAGYFWEGTTGLSTSADYIEMFASVRQQQPLRITGAWVKSFQAALVAEKAQLLSVALRTAGAASGSNFSPENRGSADAYPIINLIGSSTNPSITNSYSSPSTALTTTGLTLAAAEVLQIDTLTHNAVFTVGARIGQTGNQYINFATSTWPRVVPGVNASWAMAGGGSCSISWRDSWR